MKQRRFADAVAADEADARAGHDLHRAVVDQEPPGNADRNVGEWKACGVVTGPGAKRNPFIGQISASSGLNAARRRGGAARRSSSRKRGDRFGLRAQVLLQPFADGVADRHACLVIDLFEVVVDSGYPWAVSTSSTWQHSQRLE